MMLTNLADILRGAGLNVVEVPGWRTRGHGQMSGVRGVLWHHTATSAKAAGDYPSQNIVTNGRSDLPGPLANLGLGRSGTWYVIAAGLAYHAGSGSHPAVGTNGNGYLIGIEAEHPGTAGNPWPAAQLDAYRRGTAALLKAYGLGPDRAIAHREWAPNRKIDPFGLDMNVERGHVARYMEDDLQLSDTIVLKTNGQPIRLDDLLGFIDKHVYEIYRAFLEPGTQPSRIPGDTNTTNLRDMVMDTGSWVYQTMTEVRALREAVDNLADVLASQSGAEDISARVREAVSSALAEGTVSVDVTIHGKGAE